MSLEDDLPTDLGAGGGTAPTQPPGGGGYGEALRRDPNNLQALQGLRLLGK